MNPLKAAILDLYNGHPNQGMRCIKQVLDQQPFPVAWETYYVRDRNEIPEDDYEAYIFSGGPGDPLEDDKPWCSGLRRLIDDILDHNARGAGPPRFAFFICHSFQILCHHLGLADVCLRHSPAFGIFPVHKTDDLPGDPVFSLLPDPFFAVDSRDWQVIGPRQDRLDAMGAHVLALEKIRPHVDYERAVMAIRFTGEVLGTQFHPEADVPGMQYYFRQEAKKRHIIETHRREKYDDMMQILHDGEKILRTHNSILPGFLQQAHAALHGTNGQETH